MRQRIEHAHIGNAAFDQLARSHWSLSAQAKEALDAAVQRGNEQLERFEKANKS